MPLSDEERFAVRLGLGMAVVTLLVIGKHLTIMIGALAAIYVIGWITDVVLEFLVGGWD